jgi:hypothetical protein
MRYTIVLFALLACGKDAISPPPPPPPPVIVKLIMAPDTGFWRGNALRLAGLVRAAVTDRGDTVAAPAVTWTLPAGFVRQGDSVLATKEARGALRAVMATAADSVPTLAVNDLSVRTWTTESRCYNNPNSIRDIENPPIGQDSVLRYGRAGVVVYQVGDWKDRRAMLTVDFMAVRFWKDGLVDTLIHSAAYPVTQDTARAAIAIPGVENFKMEADSPRVYRAAWNGGHSTWCSDYIGGGTDFVLKEP